MGGTSKDYAERGRRRVWREREEGRKAALMMLEKAVRYPIISYLSKITYDTYNCKHTDIHI